MTTKLQTEPVDLPAEARRLAGQARAASWKLAGVGGRQRNEVLRSLADLLEERTDHLVQANGRDLDLAGESGASEAFVGKLRIGPPDVATMAAAVRRIGDQTDPVGQVIEGSVRPNGLRLEKVRVPLGVILIIYESRPNVTCDAAALCLKAGNATILRGGKEAAHSNAVIAEAVRDALEAQGLDRDTVQLVQTSDRALVGELLKRNKEIDVVIPRGGAGLIRAVVEQSHIPVIKHFDGICHVYVDRHALELPEGQAAAICVNAKAQRPGVCNAAETLLFHEAAAPILRETGRRLRDAGVEIRGCELTRQILESAEPATEDDWSTEYLDKIVSIRVVSSLADAVEHINRHGSGHTDAILTADIASADAFVAAVDSANVMVNCSTRFSDGGEYGLGAEIGISTDKLHARGPMGAADLTTYKWVVRGDGQVRQ
ncbi:MAG: glutamate-5-semialdehyde dehydrogenase [Phycisphaerae bacterium]|nr:glutamate-5-semialdehyde dehydrogenase [Phycisphaerae bacterium]